MTIVTRENIHLELGRPTGRTCSDSEPEVEFRTYSGTLSWDTDNKTLDLLSPDNREVLIRLTMDNPVGIPGNMILLKDVPYPARVRGVTAEASGALDCLRTLGVIGNNPRVTFEGEYSAVTLADDLGAAAQAASTRTATVTLFKPSGKMALREPWRVPVKALGPRSMRLSPDFRRIAGGAVLVDADAAEEYPEAENWGYPHLLTGR